MGTKKLVILPDFSEGLEIQAAALIALKEYPKQDVEILFEESQGSATNEFVLMLSDKGYRCKPIAYDSSYCYLPGQGLLRAFRNHYFVLEYLRNHSYSKVIGFDYRGLLFYVLLAKKNLGEFKDLIIEVRGARCLHSEILGSSRLFSEAVQLGLVYFERKTIEMADELVVTNKASSYLKSCGYEFNTQNFRYHQSPKVLSSNSLKDEVHIVLADCPNHTLSVVAKSLNKAILAPQVKVNLYIANFKAKAILESELDAYTFVKIHRTTSVENIAKSIRPLSTIFIYNQGDKQSVLSLYFQSLGHCVYLLDVGFMSESLSGAFPEQITQDFIPLNSGNFISKVLSNLGSPSVSLNDLHLVRFVNKNNVPQGAVNGLLSVCIVHYERPEFLKRTLNSLRKQTLKDFEVIIVDDGSSSEATLEALLKIETDYQDAFTKFKVYRKDNEWLGAARNYAANRATGEYLVFCDDDNIPMPHMLSTYRDAIQTSGNDALTCFQLGYKENSFTDFGDEVPQESKIIIPIGGCQSLGTFENVFGDASCIVKKDVFFKLGGYWEHQGLPKEDHDFFYRLVSAGYRLEVVPKPLYYYRLSDSGMMSSNRQNDNFNYSCISIVANSSSMPFKNMTHIEDQLVRLIAVSSWTKLRLIYGRIPSFSKKIIMLYRKFSRIKLRK